MRKRYPFLVRKNKKDRKERSITMRESSNHKLIKTALLAFCMLVLLGGGIFVGIQYQNWAVQPAAAPMEQELDGAAKDWAGTVPPDQSGESQPGIKIPGYASISIPANEQDVKISLLNPEENPCYFTFELVLDDTGETLYASKLVEPGKAIQEQTLSRSLDAGEYGATIKISTFSLKDQAQMNGANVKTKLVVV